VKKITILTLFPEIFVPFKNFSIIKKAINNKHLKINVINFRQYANNKHMKVDDYPTGGGAGMIISLPSIVMAIRKCKTKNSHVILLSPQGKIFNQNKANKLATNKNDLIIICGHYEGFDARIINYVDEVISIGDYILTGGETAAMVLIDAISRLVKNVISKESLKTETLTNNLLDYDNYTKPKNFEGHLIPDILFSGNHKKIAEFRKKNRILKTKKYRPDLLSK
jgi:tRNA (guanine37-N1)-methyltransferase